MILTEYEKIQSDFKSLAANENDIARLDKLTWCATEKIHGANFRFIYQDKRLSFGKRKEVLNWTEDFFGFQKVAAEMEPRVLALFEKLTRDYHVGTIVVYGELFGGIYPHPEVQPNDQVDAIQTGIYYSPDIHFCAYDIAFADSSVNDKTYLSYEKALYYFREFAILHAKPLQTGRLSTLLNMDLRVETQIPREFQLPAIANNIIEGVVIKPFAAAPTYMKMRPILKLKNPEFEENTRFHEAKKWSFIPDVNLKSRELDFLLQDLYSYVTLNRMNSAISKTGGLSSRERRQEVEDEFLEDVLTDFDLNNHGIWSELDAEQKSWISNRIRAEIRIIMK